MTHRASRSAAHSLAARRVYGDGPVVVRDRLDPRCVPSLPDHHGQGCTRREGIVAWRAPREKVNPDAVFRLR